MSRLEQLQREWDRCRERRRRQIELFESTHRRGHARKASQIGRQMRRLAQAIDRLEKEPKWKMAWAAKYVARWEGLRTEAYQDSGGIWTIGYGHTGKYAYPGNVISPAFALVLLANDLRSAAQAVARHISYPLTIRQRIAAISFTFNVGEGGLLSSTFLHELNNGHPRKAADALLLWVKDAAGNTLAGLVRRRRAERRLFLSGVR